MKYRVLDLHNDYWVRLVIVPFLGFCVPYITNMIPDGNPQDSFICRHPSVFTVVVVIIVFELNRYIVKMYKGVFTSKNFHPINRLLIKFIFQLVYTFCLLFLFLSIWYSYFLKLDDYFELMINTTVFGLVVTLIFL